MLGWFCRSINNLQNVWEREMLLVCGFAYFFVMFNPLLAGPCSKPWFCFLR